MNPMPHIGQLVYLHSPQWTGPRAAHVAGWVNRKPDDPIQDPLVACNVVITAKESTATNVRNGSTFVVPFVDETSVKPDAVKAWACWPPMGV
jgi:hypothetical protein